MMTRLAHRVLNTASAVGLITALHLAPSAVAAQDFDYDAYVALFGETVTQGATGAPMRASRSPISMSIITQKQIQESPSPDIAGLLDHLAGVSVVRRQAGQADVGIRGFNQPKPRGLLVLVNGRQVYLDSYGSTDWEAIPVQKEEIKQIEVIRGPNGALYGFNAAEGVINIITDDPLYDQRSFVLAQLGNDDGQRFAGGIALPLMDRGGIRVTFGSESSNEFGSMPAAALATQSDRKRLAVAADMAIKLTDDTNARIELSDASVNHSEIGPLYGVADSELRTRSIKADLSHDFGAGSFGLTFYLNTLRDGPVDNEVWVGQGRYLRKLGPHHTVRLSAEYRTNRTRQRGTGIEFGIKYDVWSSGLMWDWTATESLSIVNAVRVDHLTLSATMPPPTGTPYTQTDYDRTHTETSFNSAIVWQATDSDQIRLSLARGMQIPSLVDWGMAAGIPDGSGGTFLFIGGDPANKISTVWNYEAGYRRALPWLGATLDADIFHLTRDDIITAPGGLPDRLAPGGVYLFKNRGGTNSNGFEVSLAGKIDEAWRWSLNYANIDVNDKLTLPAPFFFPTDFEHAQPRHVVNGVLTYNQGHYLATVGTHYQSDSSELALTATGFRLQDIDAFVDAEVKLAYRFTDHASISFQGTNLLTVSQKESSIGEVDRRLFVTLSANF